MKTLYEEYKFPLRVDQLIEVLSKLPDKTEVRRPDLGFDGSICIITFDKQSKETGEPIVYLG